MDFEKKYRRLMERRFDTTDEGYHRLANSITASESKALSYLLDAMDAVSPELALRAGKRVRDELKEAFDGRFPSVEFDFQGSTTNGTNIKKNSDIDLLVAHGSCFSAEPGTHRSYPDYSGSILNEVLDIRVTCISELKTRYWAATVNPGAKSIKVSGGSLERDVDVVPCNWYRDSQHEKIPNHVYLGIRIWDVEKKIWIYNFPFLHNALIEIKDKSCGGSLRKLIRLLKNLREDADTEVKVSSYEITALVYLMDDANLKIGPSESPIRLMERLLNHLTALASSPTAQALAMVPHGRDPLFGPGRLQVDELKKLSAELASALKETQVLPWSTLTTQLNSARTLAALWHEKG